MKITGLDKLQRELNEISRALQSLDGEIATVKVNPQNPQVAIRQMETAVDDKIAPYRHNDTVIKIANAAKDRYRAKILQLAAEAKQA